MNYIICPLVIKLAAIEKKFCKHNKKKFRAAFGKIIDENKTKNNNLLKDLEKVTKNISNDKNRPM